MQQKLVFCGMLYRERLPMIGDINQFVTDAEGRKVAALVPVEDYNELLEDVQDLAVIAERRDEPGVAWDDVKRRLRENGLLHD
jgi:hypothetical protein